MIDLEELETFVGVTRTGNFARAAKVFGVTPAMIGRRIHSLEQRYGARLIERTTRKQRLTEAGETFLTHAQLVLDAVSELEETMQRGPGLLEGRVRMTGPATLGVHRLAGLIARFTAVNQAVTVEMVLTDTRADLVAEGYDFAVRIGELPGSSMIVQQVGIYRLLAVAAPAFLALNGEPRSPGDLLGARCLLNLNISPRNRWPFRRNGRQEIAEVTGALQINNDAAQRAAVLDGAGIAYLPEDLVREDVANGRLVRLLPDWETMSLPIQIIRPSRRVPRRISALIEHLAGELHKSHAA